MEENRTPEQSGQGKFSPSRRGFLKIGLIGTGVAAAGGVGLALRRTVLREAPAAGLKVLSEREYSVLAAVADRICPALGEGAPGATKLDVARKADEIFATLPQAVQKEFKILLGVFESALTGALFGERIRPFTQLSPEEQDEVLEAWRDSSVAFRRTAFRALSGLAKSIYWGEPQTWARVGYGGPPDPKILRSGFSFLLVDFDSLRAKR